MLYLSDLQPQSSSMANSDAGEEATATTYDTTFTVSVFSSKTTGDVLFLEAGKDFVDTLISFLVLPVGAILQLLSNYPSQVKPLGGISGIHASVGRLGSSLLLVDKNHLLEPRPAPIGMSGSTGLLEALIPLKPTLRPSLSEQPVPRKGWPIPTDLNVHDNILQSISSKMRNILDGPDENATLSPKGLGYVSDSTIYLVTDGLEIMPSTTIQSIEILNQLNFTSLAGVESNDVSVNITQVLQLLRSALTSSTCLNEVFGKR